MQKADNSDSMAITYAYLANNTRVLIRDIRSNIDLIHNLLLRTSDSFEIINYSITQRARTYERILPVPEINIIQRYNKIK